MPVDGVNLATDGINGIIQFLLGSLILLDYRLTLKRGNPPNNFIENLGRKLAKYRSFRPRYNYKLIYILMAL